MGHIMRCLALAQEWRDNGGTVTFVMSGAGQKIVSRLADEQMDICTISAVVGSNEDISETIRCAEETNTEWIIIDGYHFGADYQRVVKQSGKKILFLDDYSHSDHYFADLVLNQNIYAEKCHYKNREPYTKILLGPRYFLLRREFWPWHEWSRQIPPVARKILVTLGGSDLENQTLNVINAIKRIKNQKVEVRILVGSANPHIPSLKSAISDVSSQFRIFESVTNIPEMMAWADLAVSGGGGTCYEMAFMGLPTSIIVLADNQAPNAEWLQRDGFALNLGYYKQVSSRDIHEGISRLINDQALRSTMSKHGREIVNGTGPSEVIREMLGR